MYGIKFKVSPEDMAELKRSLERLPARMRGKIVRKGLREWGAVTKSRVKSAARSQDRRTKRGIIVKTKTYRRGRSIWCAVGVRRGRREQDVGYKSHLHDGGYRPWKKGLKADGTPKKQPRLWNRNPNPRFVPFSYRRDWRKDIRKRSLGSVIYRIGYISNPGRAMQPVVRRYIEKAIAEAIRSEKNNG